MREIKFRAWDEESKQMLYFDSWEIGTIGVDDDSLIFPLQFRNKNPRGTQYRLSSEPEKNDTYKGILMQYTGLKDKNGKEIYDGDIINREDGVMFQVMWDDKQAVWEATRITKEGGVPPMQPDNWYLHTALEYYNLIGNIYENPDLLREDVSKILNN